MNTKKTVLVLFGGSSCEHEVSLASSTSILTNINREKYDVVTVGITKEGKWLLFTGDVSEIKSGNWEKCSVLSAFIAPIKDSPLFVLDGDTVVNRIKIDVVFPAMHGTLCEDGTLQGLFELANIPFVGPGCLSSAVCMDKATTKLVLKNYGIPQAKALMVTAAELENGLENTKKAALIIGYPLFVKPSAAGSSVGVSKVTNEAELESAILNAIKVCDKVLIEEYIEGREIEVAVIGNSRPVASVCGEIAPGADFYDYDTKYKNDTASYFIPARIPADISEKVRKYAVKIYRALGCKGLSRVDFFVGDRIIFNEINTLPGFTDISMYPKLMTESGMSYSELITTLIELALENA